MVQFKIDSLGIYSYSSPSYKKIQCSPLREVPLTQILQRHLGLMKYIKHRCCLLVLDQVREEVQGGARGDLPRIRIPQARAYT